MSTGPGKVAVAIVGTASFDRRTCSVNIAVLSIKIGGSPMDKLNPQARSVDWLMGETDKAEIG